MSRKLLAIAPALLLALVSLWEIAATHRDATSVPDDAAWDAAATIVRADYRPGDLIVFAPEWIDPVGRLHLGDLITPDVAARMDAARFGRIWEVSIRGARSHDVNDVNIRPAFEQTVEGVTVRRFERTPAIVVTDFARAAQTSDGVHPSLELAEVGFAPHTCLQVIPVPGKSTRVTFHAAQLGTTLVGYVGLADVFTRRDVRAPGELAVEIDGVRVADVHPGVDDGWVRFETPTRAGAHDVVFTASATAPQRLICFAAEARQ
ncbi:MAG TPA: hypothetical protein VGG28_00315 [Kofleriaceae bacterium]